MLKPYAKYKETPALWLNSIPDHWESHKIRELFVERSEKVSDKDYSPLSVSKAGVVPQIATVAKTNNGDNRKLVRKGDFVINSRSDRRGSSGISNYDGSVSLINIVLKPRSFVNGRYMHYLLKSHYFIEEFYRNGRGIVADLWTTRYTEMKSIYLPVPSIEEQDQIVRFLDWKLAKINKLIRAKKKQIALLNEQKQAIINKAVTKGLDDTVPMKDSGIEWIGEIPQDWQITRIKNIGTAIIGLTYSPANLTDENGTLVFRSSNIKDGKIIYEDNVYVDCEIPEHLKTVAGDILICSRNGSRALVGKCAIIDENSQGHSFGAFTTVLRTKYSKFIYYILNSCILKNIMGLFSTSTINQLTTGILNNIYLPFPPLDVQTNIVKYLDSICMKFDSIIDKLKKEIDLITEYKTSLISSVVTGKIDVRDIEIPEYEADSDETIDDEIDDNLVLDEEDGEMEVE